MDIERQNFLAECDQTQRPFYKSLVGKKVSIVHTGLRVIGIATEFTEDEYGFNLTAKVTVIRLTLSGKLK